jgi:hypothetical protein
VVYFPDGEAPTISLWSPAEGVSTRLFLYGSLADAPGRDGNFGLNFELRGEAPSDPDTASLYFQSFRGWAKFWEKRVTIIGGKLDDNGVFRVTGGIDEDNMVRNDLGFHFRVENLPHPALKNLSLGATLMPGATGEFDMTNILSMAHYRFAARYLIPTKLSIVGMFYDNAQTEIYPHKRLDSFLAFDVLAFRPKGFAILRADFAAWDMQDKDYFNMKLGTFIVYRKKNWEFGGRYRQFFLLGNAKDQINGYSPESLFRLWGLYSFKGGAIRPRVEVGYLLHGFRGIPTYNAPTMRQDAYEAINSRRTVVDPTMLDDRNKVRGFNQDVAYLVVVPQCEFRPNPRNSTALVVGGGPLFDLTVGKEMYNYFIFTGFRINF